MPTPQIIRELPPLANLESIKVLKAVNQANRALAELKGVCQTIPNSAILINTLVLQEAKDSSAIENIVTTHDRLYQSDINLEVFDQATKEVKNYSLALKKGYDLVNEHKMLITRYIIQIQQTLEENSAGIRVQPGTVLKNEQTGQVVYTPPQYKHDIIRLLTNLENYIHSEDGNDPDPLIKMAVIHYQFESIHPFYDGNGRTGRIINVLYLILKGYLDIPVLYLSRYIIEYKTKYYQLLQRVRTEQAWEEWILFMLAGIREISLATIHKINEINRLMQDIKFHIKKDEPKIYSKDLLEALFLHVYTKIDFVAGYLGITRQTASSYLNKLEQIGILKKEKIKNQNFYINIPLFNLFVS